MYRSLLLALLALFLVACPTGDDDDDSAADDDDSSADDDDAIDDDDTGQPDDDDVVLPDCSDQGGVTLTMDGDTAACEVEWVENSVAIRFVEVPDCGGACSAMLSGGDAQLQPASMKLDLGGLDCTVTKIEVDLTDSGGAGTAAVLGVDNTGALLGMEMNTQVGVMETIEVDPGSPIEAAGVIGCDTLVHEIRLY